MSIGYLPVGEGRLKGFDPVRLENADGVMMNPLGAESDATTVVDVKEFPTSPMDDYKGLNFIYHAGRSSYPLTMVSYLLVRRNVLYLKDAGALLKAFLKLVLSQESQDMLPGFGFFKLTPELLAFSKEAINMLEIDPAVPPFTFEETAIAGTGAGPRVLSSLRQSITAYEMNMLYVSISRVSAEIDLELKYIREGIRALETEKHPDGFARTVGRAGLAIGLFGAFLSILNLWMVMRCLLARTRIAALAASAGKVSNSSSMDEEDAVVVEAKLKGRMN